MLGKIYLLYFTLLYFTHQRDSVPSHRGLYLPMPTKSMQNKAFKSCMAQDARCLRCEETETLSVFCKDMETRKMLSDLGNPQDTLVTTYRVKTLHHLRLFTTNLIPPFYSTFRMTLCEEVILYLQQLSHAHLMMLPRREELQP